MTDNETHKDWRPEVDDANKMGNLDLLVEKFEAMLRPSDKQIFQSGSFEDVQRELFVIQSQRDKTKSMMNMNRIRDFLNRMEELKEYLELAEAGEAGQAMAYIWGSVRFLLKVCIPSIFAASNEQAIAH